MRHTTPIPRPASQPVPDYSGEPEAAHFSPESDWMPELVLVARNTYVWLEQLSRRHGRSIRTLSEIPDEELDRLASQGLTGLWLIGIWERSRASERIKQRMGQLDAAASAYSIHDYNIAADLGGWGALQDLSARCGKRGIRLAADMVPNHMGIDSRWVIDYPDRFLSLEHAPYAEYTFHSTNLCDDPGVEIRIEDHYYDKSDAAVVFQRREVGTGDIRYIYHGNDGTSYPWNDTAQLDYSRADVREAVIETILHVTRHFPIIRFDAAMTLAKSHIQRLWFPEPGKGAAVPSRAEHGMSRAEFDRVMPREFWREVVDRVAAERPDTLLLAEAFWLLEGYFVRTLGLNRVYNSAFMNMLRDEKNADFRQLIKNTVEFDPEILKRHVNFMSNPDEKTALEQFGTGDKYFGVCTLMVTLPGLPMFGHGQVEGLRERYGMEFRAPRLEEQPDESLVREHERKIFPLLKRRHLFASAEDFAFFDLHGPRGRLNENVIAYSNRRGGDRALVIYHNKKATARGRLRDSAAMLQKSSGQVVRRSLAEALDLPRNGCVVFRDHVTRLEYVRDCADIWEKGFYAELGPYEHQVLIDWRLVYGTDWAVLCKSLNGAGVPDLKMSLTGRAETDQFSTKRIAPGVRRTTRQKATREASRRPLSRKTTGRASAPKGSRRASTRRAGRHRHGTLKRAKAPTK